MVSLFGTEAGMIGTSSVMCQSNSPGERLDTTGRMRRCTAIVFACLVSIGMLPNIVEREREAPALWPLTAAS